jgi:5'-nucleotidase
MRLLLTNDDGFDQPGLLEMERVLSPDHEVWVVAPLHHCSGSSHALGLYASMKLHRAGERRWSLEGTPTDCVKIALQEVMKDSPPDLVISGINPGANLANNILYSGTVAAATEAALWGIPAMAVSVHVGGPGVVPRFATASEVLLRLLASGIWKSIPPGDILNVNVPDTDFPSLGSWKWTRMGRFSEDMPFTHLEPGRVFAYGRYRSQPVRDSAGTDAEAIGQGSVSLTMLLSDRTSPCRPPDLEPPDGSP